MLKILDNHTLALLVISILVHRAGGSVTITQADVDSVAYGRLLEAMDVAPGSPLELVYESRANSTAN